MNNINETNELIAKFMYPDNKYSVYYIPEHKYIELILGDDYDNIDYFQVEEVKYRNSWNWLMPVVEKIESLGYFVEINRWVAIYEEQDRMRTSAITIKPVGNTPKIIKVYDTCVEFIKWYNKLKK